MKISVITINLNNKNGLNKTINSVKEQNYDDFEFIVIDGASSDKSKTIIEKKNNYINKWISEPDNGIYNAMNKGINLSSGEYCIFINSGDTLTDDSVLTDVAKTLDGTDIIYGNIINGKKIQNFPSVLSGYYFYKYSIAHPGTFIKSKLFDLYGDYDEKLKVVSDWKFFFDVIVRKGCSTKKINRIISQFEDDGISNQEEGRKIATYEREKVVNELFHEQIVTDWHKLDEILHSEEWLIGNYVSQNHFVKKLILKWIYKLKIHLKVKIK